MPVVTRRRLIAGIILGGVGYFEFFHTQRTNNINTTDTEGASAGIVYSGDPIKISGSGETVGEPFEITNSGPTAITFKSDTPTEAQASIYKLSTSSNRDIHFNDPGVGAEISPLATGEYDLNVGGSPGEWQCSIYDYKSDFDVTPIEPPFEASGVGDAPIGPVRINPDYPTVFEGLFDTTGELRLVNRRGELRKRVYESPTDGTEYQTNEHFGGVGFIEITSNGEWEMSVSQKTPISGND